MSLNVAEQFIWTEAYRPHKVEDCVLPSGTKQVFKGIIESGKIPNMLLSGTPGTGKTTVARALCDELGADYIVINGSMDGNIDTLRTTIKQFASTVSFSGNRKVVILDEADYLNPQSTQPALRGFIEEFANNCSFILTCNFKNRILDAVSSRLQSIDFRVPKEERKEILQSLLKRMTYILKQEKVSFDTDVLVQAAVKYFPDYRKLINALQKYVTASGSLDKSFLTASLDISVERLFPALRDKDFKSVRAWVVENLDNDTATMYRKIYDGLYDHLKPESVPQAVILIADYQYKNSFSADAEVCLLACLTEIMVSCEMK